MLRLSQKDMERLGLVAQGKIGAPEAKKARRARKPTADAARVRGGRLERRLYDGDEVVVEIDFEPRPKERARTFMDERALIRAYTSSRGDLGRFMAMVKGHKGGSDGEAEGGVMRSTTPEATRQFEAAVGMVCARAMAAGKFDRFACPVEAEIVCRLEGDPMTWPTAQADGDLDNLEKAVLDGMNKVVYVDDRLVVRKGSIKECAATPGITVKVRPAAP